MLRKIEEHMLTILLVKHRNLDPQTLKEREKKLKRIKYQEKAKEKKIYQKQKAQENRLKMEAKDKARFTKVGKPVMDKALVYKDQNSYAKVKRRSSELDVLEFLAAH